MALDRLDLELIERRVDEILGAYLVDLDRGAAPDRGRLLELHPEYAVELREFFASLDKIRDLTGEFRAAGTDSTNFPSPAPAWLPTSLSVISPDDLLPDGETAALAVAEAGSGDVPPHLGAEVTDQALPTGLSPGPPLRRFGDFTILQPIGHGGMGFVFKARQISLNRLVALKLLAGGPMAPAADVELFQKEVQAVARLDHPNIVPIYEVGLHEGQHFFSMKLIEPGDLLANAAAYAADRRAAARLVAKIAHAVHHAHQHGILHRDLKPSNILVDQDGVPLITDFGLAQLVDAQPAAASLAREPIGTPAYMAPEQARGDRDQITTATDVYGLGAILYTLLAGHPPYNEPSRHVVLERAKSGDPIPPLQARRKHDRDLNTICLKCLEKQPDRRYESARELADDLERWLAGEPIQARPISRAERVWRWCCRNRVIAAALVVVWLAFFLSAAVLAFASVVTLHAKNRAEVAQQSADARFVQARQAVDEMYTEIAERWLANQPRLKPLERRFLERAARAYQGFLRERSSDPQIAIETAKAHRRLGEIQTLLGENVEAGKSLGAAISLLKELTEKHPAQTEIRHELGQAFHRLGSLQASMEQSTQASASFRKASAVFQDLVDSHPESLLFRQSLARSWASIARLEVRTGSLDHAERGCQTALRQYATLVQVAPARVELQSEMSGVLNDLALLAQGRGDFQAARLMLSKALTHQAMAVEREPDVPRYRHLQSIHTTSMAGVYVLLGTYAEAEHSYRQAIEILTALVRDFPTVPEFRRTLALGHSTYASMLQVTGRLHEAESELSEGLRMLELLGAEFPDLPGYEHDLIVVVLDLGQVRRLMGRLGDAELAFRQAAERSDRLAARAPDSVSCRSSAALSHILLGRLLESIGRLREAETHLRTGADRAQALASILPSQPDLQELLSASHATLGNLLQQSGRFTGAENVYREAIATDRKLLTSLPGRFEYRHNLARDLGDLASLLKLQHRYSEAGELYDEALTLQQQLVNDFPSIPHPQRDLAATLIALAELGRLTHKYEPAERDALQGEAILRGLVASPAGIPDDRRDWAESLNLLGRLEQETKRTADAERTYRRARDTYRLLVSERPDRPDYQSGLAATLDHLAGVLDPPQRLPESRDLLEEALKHQRIALATNPADRSSVLFFSIQSTNLARVLLQLGEHAGAVKQLQELESTLPHNAVALSFAAGLLGACPLRAAQDPRLPPSSRAETARVYERLAEHMIEKAAALAADQADSLADRDRVNENLAQGQNSLAWYFATCPDRSLRDPRRATALARQAVDRRNEEGGLWSTLGTALYRQGNWTAAISAIEQAIKRPHRGEGYDWTILAASHAQLGHADEAKRWYGLATAWLERSQNRDQALAELHAEARKVIQPTEREREDAGRSATP